LTGVGPADRSAGAHATGTQIEDIEREGVGGGPLCGTNPVKVAEIYHI
jgi:hypothetical protein